MNGENLVMVDADGVVRPVISLRDWFAGMAMQGLCADPQMQLKNVAAYSYETADEMLAERDKKPA